jgi:hypothetical protein
MDFDLLISEDDNELSTSTTSELESKSALEFESESEAEAKVEVVEEKIKSTVYITAIVADNSEFPLLHSLFSLHPLRNVFDQLLNRIVKYSGGKYIKIHAVEQYRRHLLLYLFFEKY